PSTKRRFFQGPPLTKPTSSVRVVRLRTQSSNTSASPSMPKERAILLAVPSGRIAKGELNLGKERMTLVMAPSPPATRIRRVGALRHFLYRPCFIEQAVTVYPASRRKADKTWAVWLPVPAVGLWIKRACMCAERPLG